MLYIATGFSTRMLSRGEQSIRFLPLDLDEVKAQIQGADASIVSLIQWESTATVLSQVLGVSVSAVRQEIILDETDELIVVELAVPRLAPGEVLSQVQIEALSLSFWLLFVE